MTTDQRTRTRRSPLIDIFIGLGLLGAASTLVPWAWLDDPRSVARPQIALFGVLLALGAYPIIRFRHGRTRESLDLFEPILMPAIFAMPTVILTPLVAAAVLVANLLSRNEPRRGVFNALQWAAAAASGSFIYVLIGPQADLSGRAVAGLALAVIASSAVNQAAVQWVVSRVDGGPPSATVRFAGLPASVWGWSFNTIVGLLFVSAYLRTPLALVLFIAPLLVLGALYRQLVAGQIDRARFDGVSTAVRALGADARPAVFLDAVRAAFAASVVELHLREGAVLIIESSCREGHRRDVVPWHERSAGEDVLMRGPARAMRAGDDGAGILEARGWTECLVAPLNDGARTIGVLLVADRDGLEGFGRTDVGIIEALAHEIAGRTVLSLVRRLVLAERRKMRELVRYATDPGFALGRWGEIVEWNEAMARLTGFSLDEVRGLGLPSTLDVQSSAGPVVFTGWANGHVPEEISLRGADGERRTLALSFTRVPDEDGEPALLQVLARDVTSEREVTELRTAFAGTVAHELRAPLTPIRGWAETLVANGERLSPDDRRSIAKRIAEQAEHLELLLTKLLDITHQQPGLTRDPADVDLPAVVERVVASVSEGAQVWVETIPPAPHARADATWVEEIVSNLVSNAVKYGQGHPVEVVISGRGDQVAVEVSDRGPGIPAHQRDRIFNLYERLEAARTSATGSGLGLYISRQLARAMGASLSLSDRPGGGTTFVLELPARIDGNLPRAAV